MAITLTAGVRAGSTTLLFPPGSEEAADEACLRLLGGDAPQRREVVALTTARSAQSFIDSWIDHVGVRPADVSVVDVGTDARSVGAEAADRSPSRNVVRPVGDLGDLDVICTHLEELLAEPTGADATRLFYLDSLSTEFREVGLAATIGFLLEVVDLVRLTGSYGFVRVDPSAHSGHAIEAMTTLADVMLGADAGGRWTIRTGRRAVTGLDGGDAALPLDDLFELLADRRRRLVVHYLCEAEGPMAPLALARRIARAERPGEEPPRDEALKRIYTGLVHVHLPKLDEHGVVSVDADDGSIRLGDATEHLQPLLALTVTDDLKG